MTAFHELLALSQLYILQENKWNDQLPIDPKFLQTFKRLSPNPPQKVAQGSPIPETKSTTPITSAPPLTPQHPVQLAPQPAPPPLQQAPAVPSKPEPLPSKVTASPLAEKPTTTQPKPFFELHPPESRNPPAFGDLHKLIMQTCPDFRYIEQIPDDREATLRGTRQSNVAQDAEVLILSFSEPTKHVAFLQNVAYALRLKGKNAIVVPAQAIEDSNGWAELSSKGKVRLLIASDYGIYTMAQLMNQVKAIPDKNRHMMGSIPLFLISDVSLYLKQPQLKPALWKALCELIHDMPPSY